MDRLLIVTLNGDPLADLGSEHAGGQCKYVRELSRHLLLKGWSIHIVTLGGKGCQQREPVAPNLVVSRLIRPSGIPYGYDVTEDEVRLIGRAMGQLVEGQKFTAILACYWLSALAVLEMDSPLPLVTTFCSLARFKMSAADDDGLLKRAEAEKMIGERSQAIIATNTAERDILEQEYGLPAERIHVVPRGIDITAFTCIAQTR
jgi:hypothetical protein